MELTPMFIAVLIVLPAVGLVTWAWLCMAQAEQDFQAISGGRRELAGPGQATGAAPGSSSLAAFTQTGAQASTPGRRERTRDA